MLLQRQKERGGGGELSQEKLGEKITSLIWKTLTLLPLNCF